MRVLALLILASLIPALSPDKAVADARELRQSELRKATLSGDTIRLKRVIKGVEKAYGGTPVDARAFEAGGIYYRILVKRPDGKLVSVIVNAKTGSVVSNRSRLGRQISEAARSTPGGSSQSSNRNNGRGNSSSRGSDGNNGNGGGNGNAGGNGGGNGNGNAGGNGNGNAGGNGNGGGNSGGKGGGNSGGNGGGNSGGNGGGNAGGNGGGNSGGNSGGKGKK